MHLKKEEKTLLWNKYVKIGISSNEANERLQEFVNYLNKLEIKLKNKNKTPEEIEKKFRNEFYKLMQKIEGET